MIANRSSKTATSDECVNDNPSADDLARWENEGGALGREVLARAAKLPPALPMIAQQPTIFPRISPKLPEKRGTRRMWMAANDA